MTWPTVPVGTTNCDAGTDVPATFRADVLDAIQKLNAMMAVVNSGQLPVGAPLSAWPSTTQVVELLAGSIIATTATGALQIAQNAYFDASSVWRYKANGPASVVNVGSSGFGFYTAPSGVTGAAITWTPALSIDGSGNPVFSQGLGAATATTQAASDNTTKLATTAMVQAAVAAYEGAQTLQSLYSTRALYTTYTNSTGRPIFVMVTCSMPAGYMSGIVNGVNADTRVSSGPGVTTAVIFMVPTGGTYSVSGGTLIQWLEIR